MVDLLTPANTQNAADVVQPEHQPELVAEAPPLNRKTHISEAFSKLLKSLPLLAKLRRNKDIEADNERRIRKTLDPG